MRERMRRELDRGDSERFDLKQGHGGIADIEFLVQFLVLQGANVHPSLIHYSDNIRQLDALVDEGLMEPRRSTQLQDIYRSYRQCVHRRVLDRQDRLVDSGCFREERDTIRALWDEVLGPYASMDGDGD